MNSRSAHCNYWVGIFSFVLAGLLAGIVPAGNASGQEEDFFFKPQLLTVDQNEGIDIADVNDDGQLDIIAGRNWYEGPEFLPRPLRLIEDWNGYVQSNGDHALDVDGDGLTDVVSGSFLPTEVYWFRNPGLEALKRGEMWEKKLLVDTGLSQNELSLFHDVDRDGKPEWVTNSWNRSNPMMIWRFGKSETEPSVPTLLPFEANPAHNGHGIGFGDINNDGREDILVETGWYERPEGGPYSGQWIHHADWEGLHASCPMLVRDVNGDGWNDLVWGKGHDFGLYWWQGLGPGDDGKLRFEEHLIDDSFSQPHALMIGDLNGDGREELISGKRVRAHNGNDPGGDGMPCMYYYRFNDDENSFERFVIDEGHVGTGLQIRVRDLNGDGRNDLAVAGKDGTWLLFNTLKE
ncbi:MAG: VCBS repeat-containing protein [Planctomycetota bacterium]